MRGNTGFWPRKNEVIDDEVRQAQRLYNLELQWRILILDLLRRAFLNLAAKHINFIIKREYPASISLFFGVAHPQVHDDCVLKEYFEEEEDDDYG